MPVRFTYRPFVLLVIWMMLMYGMTLLGHPSPLKALYYIHINNGLFGFISFFLFYITISWPLPVFLRNRNWWALLSKLIPLILFFILFKYFIAHTFFREEVLLMGTRGNAKVYRTFGQFFFNGLWSNTLVVLAAVAYVLFFSWLEEDKRRKNLDQQKQQAEFAFLKMQLNTHFLMNSLNSIYSLALVRSPQVVDATHTLSDILEYMVAQPPITSYRSKLVDEIRYLEDYIALQRLRTGCEECIQLTVAGDPHVYEIAPLLLVPFVENAFKHGIANQAAKPVTIHITCTEEELQFTVFNFKSGARKDKTGGIGLHNVRKRLDLVYPGQYQLEVQDNDADYYCKLSIRW
ncbi:sensor histidine kinase [Chitinophaga niabensis]|uniref:Histidine kinase n=1 Tax=Chitinophaga niabensis TaxID=536979 RepID=A0A1N6DH40_9BACT|nr:histidine kinase [Chitinophaga niabensis]SIN70139.1 Histidine kinase [Chitinophaga niabensis]